MSSTPMSRTRRFTIAGLIAVILLILLIAPAAAQSWQTYKNLRANYLEVLNGLTSSGATTLGATTAGALNGTTANFTGNVSTDGNMTVYGAQSVGTFLYLSQGTQITLTMAGTLTPTASYQPVVAAGNIGLSDITSAPAGALLRVVNVGTPTITFTDTGTLRLSSTITLGQYDSLLLMSAGVGQGWIQMGSSDN